MFEVEDIREWRDMAVLDPDGSKIGTLEAVYYDTATQQPAFATVKTGLPGLTKLLFVPLSASTVSPKHLRVQTSKKQAKNGPSIDADGELEADLEPTIYSYYNQPYVAGEGGERRLGRR